MNRIVPYVATVAVVTLAFLVALMPAEVAAQRNAVVANPADGVRLLSPPLPLGIRPATRAVAAGAANEAADIYCLTTSLQEVWSEEAWIPFSQQLNGTCDDQGRRLEIEGQSHFIDTWELNYVWKMTYDGAGNRTEWLHLDANAEGSAYENDERDSWEYDGAGNELVNLEEIWDGSQWVPDERTTTEYNGDEATVITDQVWDGAQWVNVERERLDESAGGYYVEEWDGAAWQSRERHQVEQSGDDFVQTVAGWDGAQFVDSVRYTLMDDYRRVEMWSGTGWVGEQNQLLTRDEEGRITELVEQSWDGSGWVNEYRARYIFDDDTPGQLEFWLDDWDGSGWADDHRQLSTLDDAGNELEELWQDWNGSEWESLQRYTRTFDPVSVAIEPTAAARGFSLSAAWPNPASSVVTVQYELGQPGPATMMLYDVLGRAVRTLASGSAAAGEHEVAIDVTALASGVYYYRLESGAVALTRSLVVR